MTCRILTLAGAVTAALVTVSPASAEPICNTEQSMLDQARQKFGEVPAFTAVVRGMTIIITVSPKGTWTMLAKHGEMLCVVVDGESWAAKEADKLVPAPQSLPTPALLRNGLLRI